MAIGSEVKEMPCQSEVELIKKMSCELEVESQRRDSTIETMRLKVR